MKKIAVIGSVNVDRFIEMTRFPDSGETVKANELALMFGGKGANQAVAARKLESEVTFFGTTGVDDAAVKVTENFKKYGVNTEYIQRVSEANTGSAYVFSDESDNRIILIEGANQYTNKQYLQDNIDAILRHDIFLIQFEIPFESIEYIIPILKKHNKVIILDPAPAQEMSSSMINNCTYLLPNEHEVDILFNDNEDFSEKVRRYPNKLIVTNGEKGVFHSDGHKVINTPSIPTEVVDTTGAGDTFAGAFAVGIAEGKSVQESIKIGIKAASFAISKQGAQTGMPNRKDLESYA